MRCEEVTGNLPDYLAGAVGETVRTELEGHLAGCSRCRSEVESLAGVWNQLGTLPEAEPRPEMRARFNLMLEAYEAGLELSHSDARRRARMAGWLRGWIRPGLAFQVALAFACLAVGAVAGHYLRTGSPANTSEIAQLRDEVHGMRQLVTVSLLQQESASERLAGVGWSQRSGQPDEKVLDALINALNRDTSVDVRLASIDALSRFADRPAIRQELLRALQKQSSPLVQIALIDLMVDIREKESAAVLKQLSGDSNVNEAVRLRAQWGLQQLS